MFRHFFQEVAGLTAQTLAVAGAAEVLHQGSLSIYNGLEKPTFFSQIPPRSDREVKEAIFSPKRMIQK